MGGRRKERPSSGIATLNGISRIPIENTDIQATFQFPRNRGRNSLYGLKGPSQSFQQHRGNIRPQAESLSLYQDRNHWLLGEDGFPIFYASLGPAPPQSSRVAGIPPAH